MRLHKFFILIVLVTFISLLYVQLQVEIFKQAYQGSLNESKFRDVLDDNSILMYNILRLKSAQNVGEELLSEDDDFQFAQKQQISEVKVPLQITILSSIGSQDIDKPNFFKRVFSLKAQAEAKTIK